MVRCTGCCFAVGCRASNSFLKAQASPRPRHEPVLSTQIRLPPDSYRIHHDRIAARSNYAVPTSKRRDKEVWEMRERLLREHEPHKSKFGAPLRPNTYVPPTSLRRDELRWQVRAELALGYRL